MGSNLSARVARLAMAFVLVASLVPVSAATAAACRDVQLVWARGSGRTIGDIDFTRFDADLRSRIGPDVILDPAYQLGQDDGFGGFDYPAEGDLAQLLEAAINPLPGGPYDRSVERGRGELVAYLTDRAALCPDEVFVLGG